VIINRINKLSTTISKMEQMAKEIQEVLIKTITFLKTTTSMASLSSKMEMLLKDYIHTIILTEST
tara:strand:- start:631 stop:825 length:195 start_codon:yes stop_codon:yes gene_type:complete